VARRIIKVIALHDCVKNPHLIRINNTWEDLSIDPLSYVEIML